jgi:hypothetical protein
MESAAAVDVVAFIVRAAVADLVAHRAKQGTIRRSLSKVESGNPAHFIRLSQTGAGLDARGFQERLIERFHSAHGGLDRKLTGDPARSGLGEPRA